MLTPDGCARKKQRLNEQIAELRCDLFVTCDNRAVYYSTCSFTHDVSPTIFAMWQDGKSLLVTPAAGDATADEIRRVETYSIQRAIRQPWHDAVRLLSDGPSVKKRVGRAAIDQAGSPWLLRDAIQADVFIDAADLILGLRKRKEEDEIEEIRASLRLCKLAYRTAREVIRPDVTELDVYNKLQSAINVEAGTSVLFPGDFACGERGIKEGGAATTRLVQPHDLYILDLFPAPAFYFGDTCRTFAVGKATDVQHRAWEMVCGALRAAEDSVRPGVYARDVYAKVKEFLDADDVTRSTFWHHAGHGIGYRGHEAPRLIPGSDDIFEAGDVFTLEPGVYSAALQGGIRVEDNYVVREHGLENLFGDVSREL